MDIFIHSAGPPQFTGVIITIVSGLLLVCIAATYLQRLIILADTDDKKQTLIHNVQLWVGTGGFLGFMLFFVVVVFIVYGVLIFVYYAKYIRQDIWTFLSIVKGIINIGVIKIGKYTSLGEIVRVLAAG